MLEDVIAIEGEPDDLVVELEEENLVKFSPTDRFVSNREFFEFFDGRLFVRDFDGDFRSYDASTARPISHIPFGPIELKGFANDGKSLYFMLGGNEFEVRDNDILLAKITDPHMLSMPERPGEEYMDGFCEFVGKPLREVEGKSVYGNSKRYGVSGIIITVPLELAVHPHIVHGIKEIGDKKTRFLVHGDMSMPAIRSQKGYVWIYYNYHFGEGGCDSSLVIKEGQAFASWGDKDLKQPEPKPFLWLTDDFRSQRGISAEYVVPKVNDSLSDFEDEEEDDKPMRIVFKGGKMNFPGKRILYVSQQGTKLKAIYDSVRLKAGDGWARRIEQPPVMATYRISLKKLEPINN